MPQCSLKTQMLKSTLHRLPRETRRQEIPLPGEWRNLGALHPLHICLPWNPQPPLIWRSCSCQCPSLRKLSNRWHCSEGLFKPGAQAEAALQHLEHGILRRRLLSFLITCKRQRKKVRRQWPSIKLSAQKQSKQLTRYHHCLSRTHPLHLQSTTCWKKEHKYGVKNIEYRTKTTAKVDLWRALTKLPDRTSRVLRMFCTCPV